MTGFSFTRKPRTAREQALLAASERAMACGIRGPSLRAENQMVVERAQGSHLFDCSGNEYIDYLLGSGPMFIGHAHPAVVAAVARQLEAGSSFLLGNEPAIRLCEAIVAAVPCAEKVTLHNSGSEATHYAMRLARATVTGCTQSGEFDADDDDPYTDARPRAVTLAAGPGSPARAAARVAAVAAAVRSGAGGPGLALVE